MVDECGDIQGLLTLEDILDEIIGEFDNDPCIKPPETRSQPDGSGIAQVRNLKKSLNGSLPSEWPKTLNGIEVEHFENFPSQRAVFTFNDHLMSVLAFADNKAQQVRIETAAYDVTDEDANTSRVASSS